MSSFLRNLLDDIQEDETVTDRKIVKGLPEWLAECQSDRPVSFDTSRVKRKAFLPLQIFPH